MEPTADPRPLIAVRVGLAETAYRVHFGAADAARVEDGIARELVEHLGEEVGFLRFVTVPFTADPPSVAGDARLEVQVGRGVSQSLRPVYLHFSLEGEGAEGRRRHSLPFRDVARAIETPGSVEGFVLEAEQRLDEVKRPEWVSNLFRTVTVARTGHAFAGSEGWYWVFPFRLGELNAEIQTLFGVRADLQLSDGVEGSFHHAAAWGHVKPGDERVPPLFHEKAMARVNDENARASLERAEAPAEARSVVVTKYVGDLGDLAGLLASEDTP